MVVGVVGVMMGVAGVAGSSSNRTAGCGASRQSCAGRGLPGQVLLALLLIQVPNSDGKPVEGNTCD